MNTRVRARPLAALVVAPVLAACGALPSADEPRRGGEVVLSRAASLALFPGSFVSVVDSVHLLVTAPDGSVLADMGQRLARRDTSVRFSLELPEGDATFDVRVVSTSARLSTGALQPRLLYQGEVSTEITGGGFSVRVPVFPTAPVLLASPDTVRLVRVPASGVGEAVLEVHNRGTDVLFFAAVDTTRNSVSQCGPSPCIALLLESRTRDVPAGSSATFRVRGVRPFTTPITLWLVSASGHVPLVVRPP